MKKTVCIDLDGTIAHFEDWKDENSFGAPIKGAKEAIQKLKSLEYKVIIFTTRANREKIADYLKKNDIPFDDINNNSDQPANAIGGKVMSDIYVDDRAISFSGDWEKTFEQIKDFAPWETRKDLAQRTATEASAVDFLANDFTECFSQMRHYDSQIWDITKFIVIELLGVIIAAWSIFSFGSDSKNVVIVSYYPFVIVLIMLASYSFGILSIYTIVRLRLYFTVVARYINEQRHFFLKEKPLNFANTSGMYVNFKCPQPYDGPSSHMISIYLIAGLNSIAIWIVSFLASHWLGKVGVFSFVVSTIAYFVSLIAISWCATKFLKGKNDLPADMAVFGKKIQ